MEKSNEHPFTEFCQFTHLILAVPLSSRYRYSPCFTDAETKAEKN